MNVTISDIRKRLNALSTNYDAPSTKTFVEGARNIAKTGRPSEIKRCIESGIKSKVDAPYYVYMELFQALVENGKPSEIAKMGDYLNENMVNRTRTAAELSQLIKRRSSGYFKRRAHDTANETLEDLQAALQPQPVQVSTPAAITPTSPTSTMRDSGSGNSDLTSQEEAALNAYGKMYNTCIKNIHCDRVLENYNRISKRFNLDLIINENTRINGIQDTIIELCKFVDTYSMPTAVKFNTVIETAWYGFESNRIEYSKSDILETAIDYFLFKEDGLESCKEILESTIIYDKKKDMRNIDILMEDEPEQDPTAESKIREFCVGPVNESSDKKETDFDKIFKKFKEEEIAKSNKPHEKLKHLVERLYSRNVSGVIEETPKLLSWIRSFFILGTATIPAIGPVIMIVGFIADKIIELHMERKELDKMITCFSNEIKASKKKLETISDPEEKERLKKYIKSLENALNKIHNYHDNLLTDEEISKKYDKMYEDMDDDDFTSTMSDEELKAFFGDDFDSDFKFETAIMENINSMLERHVSIASQFNNVNSDTMYEVVSNVDDQNLATISKLAAMCPNEFFKESVLDCINDTIDDIRKNRIKYESGVTRSIRISALTNAKSILETVKPIENPITIIEANAYTEFVTEAYEAMSIIIATNNEKFKNPLLEASISNTLKMASMKLRSAMQKMSDKDRQISRNIDASVGNMTKAAERAVSNDNRESIIKGTVLPSASKIIKMTLANAGLIALGQPAIAVIGTLAYLGCSSKFKAKERQMIVDEIEIELKMCQKYIDIAESKNDMRALKQLLMIQRDLERQLQRIKYKMKVDFGQKVYDTKGVSPQ